MILNQLILPQWFWISWYYLNDGCLLASAAPPRATYRLTLTPELYSGVGALKGGAVPGSTSHYGGAEQGSRSHQNQADTRHAHTGETLHYCLGLPTQTLTLTSNTSCLQFGPSVTRVTRLSPVTDFSGTFCHAPKYWMPRRLACRQPFVNNGLRWKALSVTFQIFSLVATLRPFAWSGELREKSSSQLVINREKSRCISHLKSTPCKNCFPHLPSFLHFVSTDFIMS